ncbi:MAG TPA: hypothetical protein VK025_06070 [Steroidobacter sp.]|jgi:hypothetical protein|nr:hypothetical protein [Steroidobacteraceae bacterium]HLS80953.1 hypothetical protein [Steroidobacter sp.]
MRAIIGLCTVLLLAVAGCTRPDDGARGPMDQGPGAMPEQTTPAPPPDQAPPMDEPVPGEPATTTPPGAEDEPQDATTPPPQP